MGGVGLGLALWGVLDDGTPNGLGLVLFFVGIGYIVLWWFEDRQVTPGSTGPNPNPGPPPSSGGTRRRMSRANGWRNPRSPMQQLIARVVVQDDRHAFAELVRRHQSAVRATLRRLTAGNHALADDLAQETFVLACRNLKSFRQEARFSTWLFRIATNAGWPTRASARKSCWATATRRRRRR